MYTLWQDLRYAIRSFLKTPGFALVAIVTLALGIGANTAIFTVVNATLLRGLPYKEPDKLFHLWETRSQGDYKQREASYPDFLDWRQARSLDVAAYTGSRGVTLTGRGEAQRIASTGVSANFFSVLGVDPMLGRTFLPEEEKPGVGRVVVLNYGLWQRLFGGDENIIGEKMTLNGQTYTVVGVMPQSFQFALRPGVEMWMPVEPGPAQLSRRYMHWVKVIARLKPNVTVEQAQADLQAIGEQIAGQFSDSHSGTTVSLISLREQIVGSVKPIMIALLAAVGLVLLIACANVANLLLARSASRQKEVAIRLALGANRARLIQQLLTESVLLALIGGTLGLFLAMWGVEALIAAIPQMQLNTMPYLRGLKIDNTILLFTVGLSIMTGILFGLVPALQSSKFDLQSTLKEGGKSSATHLRQNFRKALVIAEVALSLVLLIGAGLMLKSTLKLLQVDPGFNTENLLSFQVSLLQTKYSEAEKVTNFYQTLLEHIESVPGVKAAGSIDVTPFLGGNTHSFYVEGTPQPERGQSPEINVRTISPGYFNVMEIPVIEGREFTNNDNQRAPAVVVVNQTIAKRTFPNENPIGKRLIFFGDTPTPFEIVGIVGDEKVNSPDSPTTGVVYFPFLQESSTVIGFIARTTSDPNKLAQAIRSECQSLDPDLAVSGETTIQNILDSLPSTFARRYPAYLIGLFALTALLLAVIGIYGVISYSVTQRTQEIGIRLALGAQRLDVIKLILGQGVNLIGTGIVIGLVGAFFATRFLESLLFGVSATDFSTFFLVASIIAGVALVACLVPARRAAKTDPMVALRYE
ncbi:MAG: ABC transporter permease [Acidobacteriota bacterium]